MASSGSFETSWIESTAPSDETHRRGSSRQRDEIAHLDDEAVAEAEEQARGAVARRLEHGPHDDDVVALAQHLEPAGEARGDVPFDACDRVVLVVTGDVRIDVGRVP